MRFRAFFCTWTRTLWVFWLRFRICLSVVFAYSLFKNLFKTTRFHTFFAFLRPRHGPLVFRIRCSSLLFAFCKTLQKPRVFSRFLNLDSNPARAFWHPNLIFGRFPSQRAGPNGFGSFCGASAPQKLIENIAFSRVFCVSVPSNMHCALPF